MLLTKFIFSKIGRLTSLLIISSFILGSFSSSVFAKSQKTEGQNSVSHSNIGMPTHRRDGGSRSGNNSCLASRRNLVALIPDQTVALTASASPELFFYVPKTTQPKTLEFVLRSEEDELIYESFLQTNGEGIISVKIPPEVRANLLQTEANYHWYLSMICNPQQRSRDLVVEGWMRQSEIGSILEKQINRADVTAQADLYQEEGLWYDALSTLAEQKKEIAEEPLIQAKWTELLSSVGLKELANESFIHTKVVDNYK